MSLFYHLSEGQTKGLLAGNVKKKYSCVLASWGFSIQIFVHVLNVIVITIHGSTVEENEIALVNRPFSSLFYFANKVLLHLLNLIVVRIHVDVDSQQLLIYFLAFGFPLLTSNYALSFLLKLPHLSRFQSTFNFIFDC